MSQRSNKSNQTPVYERTEFEEYLSPNTKPVYYGMKYKPSPLIEYIKDLGRWKGSLTGSVSKKGGLGLPCLSRLWYHSPFLELGKCEKV